MQAGENRPGFGGAIWVSETETFPQNAAEGIRQKKSSCAVGASGAYLLLGSCRWRISSRLRRVSQTVRRVMAVASGGMR